MHFFMGVACTPQLFHQSLLQKSPRKKNQKKYHIQPDLIGKFCCCLMFFVERILDDWIFYFILCRTWYRMIWHASRYLSEQRSKSLVDLSPGNWKSSSWESQGPEHVLPPSSPNNPFTLPETNTSHLKTGHPNRKLVFQTSIFRCHVRLREGIPLRLDVISELGCLG